MKVDEVLEGSPCCQPDPEPAGELEWVVEGREEEEEETAQEVPADVPHQLVDASDSVSSADLQLVVDVVDAQVVEASWGWRPRHPRLPRKLL